MTSVEDKVRARKAVSRALAAGLLVQAPCEQCHAPKAQAHHEDYSKPLVVRWLCASCHSKLHNQKHALRKACEVCGDVFTPKPTKRARAKTCSPKCRAAAISRALKIHRKPPVWAKLDDDIADLIRRKYAAGGTTHRKLAREFNVHHSSIGLIVRRKVWVRPIAVGLSVSQLEQ